MDAVPISVVSDVVVETNATNVAFDIECMLVSVISRPILETIIVNDTAADIDVLCRGFIVDPYSHIMNNQPYVAVM
ncbi:MAG: hypothetical protein DMD62_06435 [Gemmatimonadetes bacterium]|nr:MAG: hypothetical protein DMD62_06435 [Gemmatimonadota bacterium]